MKAIYPGSFDPITRGHLDIICRISKKFDKVIVAVLNNKSKRTLFTTGQRLDMIREEIEDLGLSNVEVKSFDGLLADFAKEEECTIAIKGLRAVTDYEAELQEAQINSQLYPDLETLLMVSKAEYSFISSSAVKEVASFGGDISDFVTEKVEKKLKEEYSKS